MFLTAKKNGDAEQGCCNGQIYSKEEFTCERDYFGDKHLFPIN